MILLKLGNTEFWYFDKNYPIMTIRDALSNYFDITTPLSQDALNSLSLHAEKEKERNNLEILANV